MSASLPHGANLEHLKKQAKALLRAFRRSEPEAVDRFSPLSLSADPKLSDAQYLVAREYGFENWARLKEHVESLAGIDPEILAQAHKIFEADDADALRRLLERHPALKAMINEPMADFNAPAITAVRSPEMLDAMLDAGADVNARSRWWAGGFGLLDFAGRELAMHAIKRGAVVTVHAAARLGMMDRLEELIQDDPELVHAPGGDGQTPLHFASSVEVASFLLDHGADIDARDVDHESTPAQYMVRSRPDVARFLIRRGCKTDILMAAALGDIDLARTHLQADSECIRMRVSDEYFPMVGPKNGGSIYQWELGWYVSARQVAREFGHTAVLEFLVERTPDEEKLLDACWLHDQSAVEGLLASEPNVADALPAAGRRHVAHAARNNDTTAASLMLTAGLPVIGAHSQHHATALHWAAWHGNAELVQLLLQHDPPLEDADNEFNNTPLGWGIHGSENGWERRKGDYGATVEALLEAGAKPPDKASGTRAVRAVLRRYGVR